MPAYPDPIYELVAHKGAAGGYPSLDGTGKIPSSLVPTLDHGALSGLADDDHPQYQKESERGAVDGYAPLDGIGVVPLVHLPPDILYSGDLATHEAAADPHTVYQKESEKGVANGYASLDSSGKIPLSQLPSGIGGGGTSGEAAKSLADGLAPSSAAAIYTVPTSTWTVVKFISAKNVSASNESIELFVSRSGGGVRSIGAVLLGPGEYVWYLDTGEVLSLSASDEIRAVATAASSIEFVILGAEYA